MHQFHYQTPSVLGINCPHTRSSDYDANLQQPDQSSQLATRAVRMSLSSIELPRSYSVQISMYHPFTLPQVHLPAPPLNIPSNRSVAYSMTLSPRPSYYNTTSNWGSTGPATACSPILTPPSLSMIGCTYYGHGARHGRCSTGRSARSTSCRIAAFAACTSTNSSLASSGS